MRQSDQLVFVINSDKACERLLNEGRGLTLEKALQTVQTHEYNQQQLKMKNDVDTLSDNGTRRQTYTYTKGKLNQS